MSKQNVNPRDYYASLMSDGPAERAISVNGKRMTIYVRKITGAERIKINGDQTFRRGGDGGAEVVMNLGEVMARTHRMIFYANVTADGDRIFKNAEEVGQVLEGPILDAVYRECNDYNAEDPNEGKSSRKTPTSEPSSD